MNGFLYWLSGRVRTLKVELWKSRVRIERCGSCGASSRYIRQGG